MLWAGSRAPRAIQAAVLGNIIYYFKQTKNQKKNMALSRGTVCVCVAPSRTSIRCKHARSLRGYGLRGAEPSTVRPLARDLRVLVGWPFPLGFGLDGRLLLARRGRVYV